MSNKSCFYCDELTFRWHGEWADPGCEYKGHEFSYWTISQVVEGLFLDTTGLMFGEPKVEDKFDQWCKDNHGLIMDEIDDYMNYIGWTDKIFETSSVLEDIIDDLEQYNEDLPTKLTEITRYKELIEHGILDSKGNIILQLEEKSMPDCAVKNNVDKHWWVCESTTKIPFMMVPLNNIYCPWDFNAHENIQDLTEKFNTYINQKHFESTTGKSLDDETSIKQFLRNNDEIRCDFIEWTGAINEEIIADNNQECYRIAADVLTDRYNKITNDSNINENSAIRYRHRLSQTLEDLSNPGEIWICECNKLEEANGLMNKLNQSGQPAFLFSVVDIPEEKTTAYLPGNHIVNNIGYIVSDRDICCDALLSGLIDDVNDGVWCEYEKGSELNHLYTNIKTVSRESFDSKFDKNKLVSSIQPDKSKNIVAQSRMTEK